MKWKKLKRRFRFNKKRHFSYLFLFLILGSMSFGYAYLNTNLSISGLSMLNSSTWDVYFDNVIINEDSVEAVVEPVISNKTTINFSVKLDKPGDIYEFTVDLVNDGSMDAIIDNYELLPVLTDDEKKYLDYSVKYSTNQEIKTGDGINANSRKKIIVHAEYKESEDIEDYPIEDKTFQFNINIEFQQGNVNTLYEVLESEALRNGLAKEYTGEHHDSFTEEPSKKIYHWYAENNQEGDQVLDKNNVIFAGQCWQMIRTTDTGGVKMIYNGEAVDNQCLSTRGTHVGYASRTSQNLASAYWYGTDYTYDSTAKTFKVSGTTEQTTWNATTGPGLIGKYTCKLTSEDGTCATLYLVESYYDTSSAYVIPLNSNSNYSQFGTLPFNVNDNSPSYVGYMYNTVYPYNSKTMTSSETMLSSSSLATTYWYAHDAIWGSPTASRYNLDSPYQVSATTDYPNLVGEYTFREAIQTYTNTSVYYIAAVNGSNMYYIQLSNTGNHTLTDFNYTYTYGDSYTDNGNGTYTIDNAATINRSDWYTSYSNVGAGKYVCKNATNDTCSELWYTTSTSNTSMTYIKVLSNNYKYAKGFTWDGSKYVLDNDTSTSFWNINDSTNKTSINNAHYTCWNDTGECTTISYIYYIYGTTPYYINITNGKSVEDAKNEMLYDDNVNTTNSTIKSGVDAWYKQYLSDYSDYLEDTIFCNDRSQSNQSNNGWNPNGGSTSTFMEFYGASDLSCPNDTDKFSVSNNKAKLTYKVGLMSSPEMNILGNSNIRKTGQYYWLASPSDFTSGGGAFGRFVNSGGNVSDDTVDYPNGVRPAVSLTPGIEYSDGDGSMANPYIVE